ncbi:MazG nucleotide pyrophosphohydrolase domain-containing protein [Variovorax sp. OK605]|uniref:MazG nucleotide pyrophosphohydrolase domain-containing protein n=1 Tax=Variovorax sp. OK605 TaxID=1855317 RepID=UPI0008EC1434|nr:MazG nucleotide pyrophosphohydrolase domain-containing protein [Variovorax sp. OK605]SFO94215.1 MazG nucleotide pyrophosphohydrolase domain-containing protein [Variovorax sp. OK605]
MPAKSNPTSRQLRSNSPTTTREGKSGPLSIKKYFFQASKTNLFKDKNLKDHYRELGFGFFGEVGGLLSALKKQERDKLVLANKDVVAEELGDALWYLVNMAEVAGLEMEKLASSAWMFLRSYFDEPARKPPSTITFRSLDGLSSQHHIQLSKNGEHPLRLLAQGAGAAVSRDLHALLKSGPNERELLFGRLLGELILVCARHELKLEEIAHSNLLKIADRWPGQDPVYPPLSVYGEPHEQLPTVLEVVFRQRKVGSRVLVFQQINGLNIGDPLTDNNHKADGYRFHDVFHLAYAVHLGWSPVIRALLKLKRKSDARIDENEDGARALIIEEGIATWIFNHSTHQSPKHYASVKRGRLDYFLLKQVRSLVAGFEVGTAPLWQWECAILDGFKIFRLLLEHKGGTVVANIAEHSMRFIPPENLT